MKSPYRLTDLPGSGGTDHLVDTTATGARTMCGLDATGRFDGGLPVTTRIVTARSTPRDGDGLVLLCPACAHAFLNIEQTTDARAAA